MSVAQEQRNSSATLASNRDMSDEEKNIGTESADQQQVPLPKEEPDPNVIGWDGPDDPENPQNWPRWRKWVITMAMAGTTVVVAFSSSVFSAASVVTSKKFHVSTEVMTLATSLFVFGFALGPLVWGPFSELFGRRRPLLVAYVIFSIFTIPTAVAVNIETIMLCRFFGGVFGAAPLAIVGGALADMWSAVDRGVAVTFFVAATFVGPVIAPVIGGFITQSHLGWRWDSWIVLIMAAFFGLIAVVLIPETYAPVILQTKARRIRYSTKNWAVRSKFDEMEFSWQIMVDKYLSRPFRMLLLEPILLLFTLYMAFAYGIVYLFFEAFPISFMEERGWSQGIGALPFLSLLVGVLIGSGIIIIVTKTRFARKLQEHGGVVVPEERLPPMMIGAFLLPIGLFWFAWTSNPHIVWVPQVIGAAPIGTGIVCIFLQGLNYIIDVYGINANSAIAANTLVRSTVGGSFPLFSVALFHTLGVPWASSLLGFLSIAMLPVPFIFFKYGAKIRAMSKYSMKL